MNWRSWRQCVAVLSLASFCVAQTHQQNRDDLQVTKLFVPAYPAMARIARIAGDVELRLDVKPDGSVEAVSVVSGPPLLAKTAVESARKSEFLCRECGEATTSVSLLYSFQVMPIDPNKFCSTQGTIEPPPAKVDLPDHQVTVYALEIWTCDPAVEIKKFRSPKCLYLWSCGHRERIVE